MFIRLGRKGLTGTNGRASIGDEEKSLLTSTLGRASVCLQLLQTRIQQEVEPRQAYQDGSRESQTLSV
jgi:hypothetical protein